MLNHWNLEINKPKINQRKIKYPKFKSFDNIGVATREERISRSNIYHASNHEGKPTKPKHKRLEKNREPFEINKHNSDDDNENTSSAEEKKSQEISTEKPKKTVKQKNFRRCHRWHHITLTLTSGIPTSNNKKLIIKD